MNLPAHTHGPVFGWGGNRAFPFLLAILILLAGHISRADDLSDGRALVGQLLARHPAKNYTATGTLDIRNGNGQKTDLPIHCQTIVTATNWQSIYQAGNASHTYELTIRHADGQPDACFYSTNSARSASGETWTGKLPATQSMTSFAGSDFCIADLGLEFFHWPQQKLLRKEIKRSRGCSVLESTNPDSAAGGYSRVVSWIDGETGGIVQAKAYDAKNQLLKEFYPKDFNKVNGEWQVGMMEMDNDQTDSRSRLEFDQPQK